MRQVATQLTPFVLLALFSIGAGLFFALLAYHQYREEVRTEMNAYARAVESAFAYIVVGSQAQVDSIASSVVPICNSILRHAAAGIEGAPLSMGAEDMLATLRQKIGRAHV